MAAAFECPMSACRQLNEMSVRRQLHLPAQAVSSWKNKIQISSTENFLFHVKQISFEGESHSKARLVRTVMAFERCAHSEYLLECFTQRGQGMAQKISEKRVNEVCWLAGGTQERFIPCA